jgi:hypothetical protein
LNRQETKFAKTIDKTAKNSWRHNVNLGALRDLAVGKVQLLSYYDNNQITDVRSIFAAREIF